MKYSFFTIIIFLFFQTTSKAQLHDSTLIKKLTINGFCLCQTTLSSLKQSDSDIKEIDVEEMDLAKGCFGEDSRFIEGKGYYSDKQKGIIFQKDKATDYISKIRLTGQFKGNLPDGDFVDLNNFRLKDLFERYPQFKDKWQSRGCSDYWRFSNDTISFYVKIDKTVKPKFPINESFYMDKPVVAIDLTVSCRAIHYYDEGYQNGQLYPNPVFFVDSVKVSRSEFSDMNTHEIAIVCVVKDTLSLRKYGADAKNEIIFIETKKFAKQRYQRYFVSKSPDYAKLMATSDNDSSIQYILNSKILTKSFEGKLASIDDRDFKGIQVINKEQLLKDYNITDKDYGAIITTIVKK
ncbi:MAG TPA: hypothetical protein VGI43_05175 [Mucilaginibacter sp.]|jgi:hypothetical protein